MRWLITGGCGFIGRNLLLHVSKIPNAVFRVIDDLSTGTREELGVLTAAERQHSLLHPATVLPTINRGARIAIATVHVRRCARNVHSELRHDQILDTRNRERQDGARTRGRQALIFD